MDSVPGQNYDLKLLNQFSQRSQFKFMYKLFRINDNLLILLKKYLSNISIRYFFYRVLDHTSLFNSTLIFVSITINSMSYRQRFTVTKTIHVYKSLIDFDFTLR
jgi:hypothetical protein